MLALSPEVQTHVAEAWRFRHAVEREAEVRFLRLAARFGEIGAPEELAQRARDAAAQEHRHAALCAELARAYGARIDDAGPASAPEIAPSGLGGRERVLYEVVAACCITETESCGVLTTLLDAEPTPQVKPVLHEIARDEVGHSRLGWALLAFETGRGDVTFLAPLVPRMLSGTVGPELFQPGNAASESPELLHHGVLPHAQKRALFAAMLEDVVFPGLDHLGVPSAPARAWLSERLAALSGARGSS